ncbi:DUF4328 domain-containing protein [Streptomyces sp. NPDC093085]|uniref:DUF4328 domain-containing protein n=1 Tax=Streptomyces sp. NPDC093085 TaxID=3155068 RepID=UPI00343F755B
MLCSQCRTRAAATAEGLCAECAATRGNAGEAPGQGPWQAPGQVPGQAPGQAPGQPYGQGAAQPPAQGAAPGAFPPPPVPGPPQAPGYPPPAPGYGYPSPAPGYPSPYAPGYLAGPPVPPVVPPVGLFKALVALFAAVVLADLYALVSGARIQSLMASVIAEDFDAYTDADLDAADASYALAGVAQTVAMLATAVVFLVWFHRVRRNAQVLDPAAQRMAPGWAIGAWFVPFANLVLPRRIAGDIWKASGRRGPDGAPQVSYVLVNLWWTVYLVSLVVAQLGTRLYLQAEEAEEVRSGASVIFAGDLLDIVAAVFAVLFVRKLTRMQEERATGAAAAA